MIDTTKPARQKEASEKCRYRLLRSALSQRVCSRPLVNRCEDRAPAQLLATLRAWLPEAA